MEMGNPREEVLLLLIDIDRKKVMSSQGLSNLLLRYQFEKKQDRAFMTRLLEGTLERQIYLDYVLNQFSSKKMEKQKPFVRCLLRMSVYQILFMDQVPDSAACNEAVKLAKKKRFASLSGFINGILRNVSRKKAEIQLPDETKDPLFYLSIANSIPQWILEYWREDYPYETVKQMAEASLADRATCVRVNQSRASIEDVKKSLEAEGAVVEDGQYLPYILKLNRYDSLGRLSAFRQGLIQVQDESSAFVGHIADPEPGSKIIDVCSAPGGKSLHLADILEKKDTKNKGEILSRDLTEQKIELIEENKERCGFTNIQTEVFDGCVLDETKIGQADLVLADVPCSGLGILARKNDIKYNATPERIEELVPLQRQILKNAAAYVKPGGVLLFSTCTISRKENEENRDWILKELPFEAEQFDDLLPEPLKEQGKDGQFKLLPGISGTDGFYIAKFRKNK
jgi:16S rRNA (cytosine967-C5)-methyltransferase